MNIVFDFPGMLDYVTNLEDWIETEGQDSRNGLDYYYKTKDEQHTSYINVDRSWITIQVDGDVLYSGDYTEDEALQDFVKQT